MSVDISCSLFMFFAVDSYWTDLIYRQLTLTEKTSQKTIIKTMRPGPGPARPVLLVILVLCTLPLCMIHLGLLSWVAIGSCNCSAAYCIVRTLVKNKKPYRGFTFFIISFFLDTLFDVRLGISCIYEPKHA